MDLGEHASAVLVRRLKDSDADVLGDKRRRRDAHIHLINTKLRIVVNERIANRSEAQYEPLLQGFQTGTPTVQTTAL